MTDPTIPVTEDELHAYVDDELPAERRGDVESWLAAHPADAERVAAWRRMAEALHARYDAVANEPVPPRLDLELLDRKPRRWILGAAAASLAAFLAGGAAGWVAHGAASPPALLQNVTGEALDAHRLYVVDVRHPVEVPGDEKAHLQQWLTRRCGRTVQAPELEATGLKLVGRALHRLRHQDRDRSGADALYDPGQCRGAVLGGARRRLCRHRRNRPHPSHPGCAPCL